ncbi:DNA polymerase II large subunit [Candidatus Woesearchaeota archaeon]|nr:DNA polymerase II large subunit [Candidatus Woesearchaeota archaeon]
MIKIVQASPQMIEYFKELTSKTQSAFVHAKKARAKGYDPVPDVEIVLAKNMAERVVGIISVVAPQLAQSDGAVKRIIELEKQYGILDWRVALQIALEVAQEKFCKFKDKIEAMEMGIKTGFAYVTVGVVSSPLDGFVNLELKNRRDGTGQYFCLNYSGPIRNAGGTAASVSVIIADFIRKKMGYKTYDPDDKEIARCFTELTDYHERVTNLQYFPSKEEADFIVVNLPVEIAGDPSEKIEVSNYKDLPRVSTNRIRNGFCLMHSSCIPLKAPKLWRQIEEWGEDFEMGHWSFLKDFLKIQKKVKSHGEKTKGASEKVTPDYTFIADLVAGRPVLGYPMRPGGFRLRYGRSRTSGYSGDSISPATMQVLDDYIATGTQLKIERPGKGTTFTPCDSIEGPIVKLVDGSVKKFNNAQIAKQYKKQVSKILYLGDVLVNYGDFLNRAHVLVPPGYVEEWWILEFKKAAKELFSEYTTQQLAGFLGLDVDTLQLMLDKPLRAWPDAKTAILFCEKLKIPLHPSHTYFFKLISSQQLLTLKDSLLKAPSQPSSDLTKIVMPLDKELKEILEVLGVEHTVATNEFIVLKDDPAIILKYLLTNELLTPKTLVQENSADALDFLNKHSKIVLRDKAGIFVGSRMGRPEKAKMRKLIGSPHVLFPVGEEGGRLRCFQSALDVGKITSSFPIYKCEKCAKQTINTICEDCETKTIKQYHCLDCRAISDLPCDKTGVNKNTGEKEVHISLPYVSREIDIKYHFNQALKKLKMKQYPDLIKGVRGTSNVEHSQEHLAKGILRAVHDVHVNKDGTVRYDASELAITHFKPKEIRVSVQKLQELGYTIDVFGKALDSEDQVLELKPQDVLLPCCPDSPDKPADEVLFKITRFIDEELVKLYGQKPFYNLKSPDDLVGHLIIGLAPHTSAGSVGRIIGFTKTQGFFAHPLYHAAMRRDVDGDESCFILLMDAFVNFSRKYLPSHRGGTMDAPLVLTTVLTPAEVDDMAFDVDRVWNYPLEFYEAALDYKNPWDVKINTIKDELNKVSQYEGMGYTHDTTNLNDGVLCSAYKLLPTMEEKLKGQMILAEKINAVDEAGVAKLVIEKHFLRDIKGNLRKFSMQKFRCVACNDKYRRPPLVGKCTNCGGRIIFTISEGSIAKYLEPSISLAKQYNVGAYLRQSLELTKVRFEDNFGKEVDKQVGLGSWFG